MFVISLSVLVLLFLEEYCRELGWTRDQVQEKVQILQALLPVAIRGQMCDFLVQKFALLDDPSVRGKCNLHNGFRQSVCWLSNYFNTTAVCYSPFHNFPFMNEIDPDEIDEDFEEFMEHPHDDEHVNNYMENIFLTSGWLTMCGRRAVNRFIYFDVRYYICVEEEITWEFLEKFIRAIPINYLHGIPGRRLRSEICPYFCFENCEDRFFVSFFKEGDFEFAQFHFFKVSSTKTDLPDWFSFLSKRLVLDHEKLFAIPVPVMTVLHENGYREIWLRTLLVSSFVSETRRLSIGSAACLFAFSHQRKICICTLLRKIIDKMLSSFTKMCAETRCLNFWNEMSSNFLDLYFARVMLKHSKLEETCNLMVKFIDEINLQALSCCEVQSALSENAFLNPKFFLYDFLKNFFSSSILYPDESNRYLAFLRLRFIINLLDLRILGFRNPYLPSCLSCERR